MAKTENARTLALQILRRWDGGDVYAETLIDKALRQHPLPPAERSFLTNLVFTILRNRSLLNAWIGKFRDGKLNNDVRRVLQIGLAQMLLLNKPPHAAVNETVELAPNRGAVGLINAILRRADRERIRLEKFTKNLPLNSKFSHPLWLVERWIAEFGKDETRALLEWNNQVPINHIRLNPLKPAVLPEGYVESTAAPGHYVVGRNFPHDLIEDGAAYITDPSTYFSVDLLAPQPGESVLDACAAPGGKAAHIAARLNNDGKLLATDSEAHRLPRLEENLKRMGVTCATTESFDWTEKCPADWQGKFDAVLLDVPCSNTGVMQRRVDVRWRLSGEEFERITELQLQLLENASHAVAPGGRLVYSTCSIEPEENSKLVQRFLDQNSDWKFEKDHLQFPSKDKTDGAYAARLVRA